MPCCRVGTHEGRDFADKFTHINRPLIQVLPLSRPRNLVHLQQVLLNLIVNGMDALDEANRRGRRVSVTAGLNGPRTVEVAVSDSGPGVPAELTQISDPFFTTKQNGMGTGLSIARTIIAAHSGQPWAENGNEAERRGKLLAIVQRHSTGSFTDAKKVSVCSASLPTSPIMSGRRAGVSQRKLFNSLGVSTQT